MRNASVVSQNTGFFLLSVLLSSLFFKRFLSHVGNLLSSVVILILFKDAVVNCQNEK